MSVSSKKEMLQDRKEQTETPPWRFSFYSPTGVKLMPRKAELMISISVHDFLLQENSCPVAKECATSTQAATSKICCCCFLKMGDVMRKSALFIYLYHHYAANNSEWIFQKESTVFLYFLLKQQD